MTVAVRGERLKACPQCPHCQLHRLAKTNCVENTKAKMTNGMIALSKSAAKLVCGHVLLRFISLLL